MIRATSKKAYRKIKESGLLSIMREAVYDCLYNHGPMTGSELDDQMNNPSGHKRLIDLERMDVAKRGRERKCKITGYVVATWKTTDGPVRPMPKKRTKLEMYQELCLRIIKITENNPNISVTAVARTLRQKVKEIEGTFEK